MRVRGVSAPLGKRVLAEALASAGLGCAVVGSGIMAQRLTHDGAVALLANTLATSAALVVLIWTFGPISGAHMNPAVTLFQAARRRLPARDAAAYTGAQIAGTAAGVVVANVMFGLAPVTLSAHARAGAPLWLSEAVATFSLILVVALVSRFHPRAVPAAVAAVIGSAYWFTASTSFANPAITLARTLSDTFAGIRPTDAPAFLVAQGAGTVLAALALRLLVDAEELP